MKYIRRQFKSHDGLEVLRMPHTLRLTEASELDGILGWMRVGIGSDTKQWCNDNLGDYQKEWTWRIHNSKVVFYFTSKDKAMAFKLRWA